MRTYQFQTHPLERIARKPVIKWVIQADEYHITFLQRIVIQRTLQLINVKQGLIIPCPFQQISFVYGLHLQVKDPVTVPHIHIKAYPMTVVVRMYRLLIIQILNVVNFYRQQCFNNSDTDTFIFHDMTEHEIIGES